MTEVAAVAGRLERQLVRPSARERRARRARRGGVGAGEFVWPDAADAPAHGAQGAGDEAVAGSVAGNFFAPELGILLGRRGVEGAAVPEAAVDEDGEAVRAENEVGFHAEGLQLQTFTFPLERSASAPAGAGMGDCAYFEISCRRERR